MPAGDKFHYLRKLYHHLLSSQRSAELRKYQDYESAILVFNLLGQPENSYGETERYSMSFILSAVYGVRLEQPEHPITTELAHLWQVIMKCTNPLGRCVKAYSRLTAQQPCSQALCSSITFLHCKSFHYTFNQDIITQRGFEGARCSFTLPFSSI